MRKLEKKFIRNHSHQEIIITGSRAMIILEMIGLWLHILALFLGSFTLFGFLLNEGSELTHIMEIITLVVVALIVLQFVLTPIIERIVLKRLLKDFWGTTEIATSMKYATEIDPVKNFGAVVSAVDSVQLEETKLEWQTVRYFPWKRVLTIQQCTPITTKRWSRYASSDGTLNVAIVPLYIIIDVHQKVIKLQGRMNVLFTRQKNIPEKRIMFTFHYEDKLATWSGVAPDHPFYGEWIWDPSIAEKIKDRTAGLKNQAAMNNKVVMDIFEKRNSTTEETKVVKQNF